MCNYCNTNTASECWVSDSGTDREKNITATTIYYPNYISCPCCNMLVESEDIYCRYCGKQLIKDKDVYCSKCGQKIKKEV